MVRKFKPEQLKAIRVCADKRLPPEMRGKEITAALEERPDNLLSRPARGPHAVHIARGLGAIGAPRMAVLFAKLWKPGRTLRVRFLHEPGPRVADRIEHHAHAWEQYANIRFEFVATGAAEIRITLDQNDGSWSYLGTDATLIPGDQATMNYGWFDEDTEDEEFSRTVLHEFGHALGAIHEHNHPRHGIKWNKAAVYAYYAETQGWSKAEVDEQVFERYALDKLNASKYDPKSIMHYAIPAELLLPSGKPVGWNRVLSAADKAFIRKQYPRPR